MALVCSLCMEPVAYHCTSPCGWVTCNTKDCDANIYDLERGLLLMRNGVVMSTAD